MLQIGCIFFYYFNLFSVLRREKDRRVCNIQGSRLYFSQTCLDASQLKMSLINVLPQVA